MILTQLSTNRGKRGTLGHMKEIVQDGSKILRETAKPVPEDLFGSRMLSGLTRDMADVLDKQPEGVALAGPQVSSSYRLFIVRMDRTLPPPPIEATPDGKLPKPLVVKPEIEIFINPEIVKSSRKRLTADEGCLSVRGIYGTTKRHERVTIRARRLDGTKVERGASGLLAQIFQHEIDHLNGILFIDHAEHLIDITKATHA